VFNSLKTLPVLFGILLALINKQGNRLKKMLFYDKVYKSHYLYLEYLISGCLLSLMLTGKERLIDHYFLQMGGS